MDCAPHDVVGDVGVVPTTQNLRKDNVPYRTLVEITWHYALVRLEVPFTLYAIALGVKRRRPVDCMQTFQTRSTGLVRRHVPAMAHHYVFATLIKRYNLKKQGVKNIC